MSDAFVITPEIVAAVTAHMNGDHPQDCVVLCRGLGGCPDTTTARMTGLDLAAIELTATDPEGDHLVRLPFSVPLTGRAQIRGEVAAMYDRAAVALGLEPRAH